MSHILIFDDDADILELCSIILRANDFEVSVRENCREVINDVTSDKPDVILMDNWIPDIGGIKATQLIKNTPITSHIPVIFFSANNKTEKYSKEAGADYFLQKPFEIADLVAVVKTAVKNKEANSLLK